MSEDILATHSVYKYKININTSPVVPRGSTDNNKMLIQALNTSHHLNWINRLIITAAAHGGLPLSATEAQA